MSFVLASRHVDGGRYLHREKGSSRLYISASKVTHLLTERRCLKFSVHGPFVINEMEEGEGKLLKVLFNLVAATKERCSVPDSMLVTARYDTKIKLRSIVLVF